MSYKLAMIGAMNGHNEDYPQYESQSSL